MHEVYQVIHIKKLFVMKRREYFRKIMRNAFFFIAVLAIFSSCSKDESDKDFFEIQKESSINIKKVGSIEINKDAVILDIEDLKKVKTIADDSVIFESKPAISEQLKEGSILVGAIYDGKKLENILGKVISIEDGKNWIVRLQPVKLEDFIYSGNISGNFSPVISGRNNLKSDAFESNVMLLNVDGFPVYEDFDRTKATISLPRIEYSDTINIPSTDISIVNIKPQLGFTVGFTPSFDYNIKFDKGRIIKFEVTMHANDMLLDANLMAYAGLVYNLSLSDLYSIPVLPIALGPTGLIISPTISAGPYFSFKAGSYFKVKLFHGEGSVSYVLTNPTKKPIWNINIDPYGWDNIQLVPKVEAEGGVKLNTGLSLTFIATNIASVQASPSIGIGSSLQSNDNLHHLNLEIYGLLKADAKVVLGVPPFNIEQSFPIVSWKPVFYSKEFTILE